MAILFEDDFNGTAGSPLDSTKWGPNVGNFGWDSVDTARSVTLDGAGHAAFTAIPSKGSGRSTKGFFSVSRGIFSAWIKMPSRSTERGYWPAFWLLNGSQAGSELLTSEVDIVETYTQWAGANQTTHMWNGGSPVANPAEKAVVAATGTDLSAAYHKYSVKIEDNKHTYYIDDVQTMVVNSTDLSQWASQPNVTRGYYIILGLAVGGGGQTITDSGATMLVDRVEVLDLAGTPTPPTGAATVLFDGTFNNSIATSGYGTDQYLSAPKNFQVLSGGETNTDARIGTAPAARFTGEKFARFTILGNEGGLTADGAGPSSTTGQRSEIFKGGTSNPFQNDGETFYYGYSIYLPPGLPLPPAVNGSTGKTGHSLCFQAHTLQPISPKVAINYRYGIHALDYLSSQPTAVPGWKLPDGTSASLPVAYGWNDYVVWCKSASDTTGFVSVWRKGPGETSYSNVFPKTNMVTSDGGLYIKWGIYTGGLTETKTRSVYFSNIKVSYASSKTDATFSQAAFNLAAPAGGTVTPTPPPTVSPIALDALVDAFDSGLSTTTWPTQTGGPTVSNSVVSFAPTGAANLVSIKSTEAYQCPGKSLITGPWNFSENPIVGGTGIFEPLRQVIYRDDTANDFLVIKRQMNTTGPADDLVIALVKGGSNDPALTPVQIAWPAPLDDVAWIKVDVGSNGSDITVSTSPDGLTWTSRFAQTATWAFSSADLAKIEVGARIQTGTPAVAATTLGGVGLSGTVVAPSGSVGTAPVPAGSTVGDLICMFVATDDPTATITNLGALPFDDLLPGDPSASGTVAGTTGNTVKAWAEFKAFDPTDTASWSLNFSSSTAWAAETFKVAGADVFADDMGVSGLQPVAYQTPSGAGNQFGVVSTASPVDNARLVILAAADCDAAAGVWNTHASMNQERATTTGSPGGMSMSVYWEDVPAAGTVLGRTITHSCATQLPAVIYSFWVRPRAGVSTTTYATSDDLAAAGRAVASTHSGNYTLTLADASTVIEMTSGSAQVVTVPPNSLVAFPVGTLIEVCQYGAGSVTLAAGAGVTIRSAGGLLASSGQYRSLALRKRGTNEWMLEGALA